MYYFYVLRCADNPLYSGITTNLKRRVKEHNSKNGKGAKYTRPRRPVKLVYSEKYKNRKEASKREAEVKSWTKEKKEKLVSQKT